MVLAHQYVCEPNSRAGRFPQGGDPCTTASTSPTPRGFGSGTPSPTATTTARPAAPSRTTGPWSTASSGTCTPAPPGPTPPRATAPGRPSTTASTAGARTAPGPRSSTPCCSGWTRAATSSAIYGASTPPTAAPTRPPPGRKKNPERPPELGGPPATHFTEPGDHGLGRSRGGFTTKVNLVCDSNGTVLAIWVVAGQRHESSAFAEVMGRARRPRRAGRPRWPERGAGDQGHSYARVRGGNGRGPAAGAGGPAALAGARGGRQGLQLCPGARLGAAAAHRASDPDAGRPGARPAVRQGDVPAAEHHRAGGGLAQVVPGAGDALRQAGGQLRRAVDHREYPIPPA